MKVEIKHLMRLQHVNRWTLVPVSRAQTVAEHSFNVAILLREFAIRAKLPDSTASLLVNVGLIHDQTESITGDIPSPTKALMKQNGFNFNEAMGDGEAELLLPTTLMAVMKAVDLWESMFFLSNWGTGKRADHVRDEIHDRFIDFMEKIETAEPEWYDVLSAIFMETEDYTDD